MLRARIETCLAVLFALATVATLIWPTWIEALTGLSPDNGGGETEWWLVLLLALATVIVGVLARRDLRVARPQAAGGDIRGRP